MKCFKIWFFEFQISQLKFDYNIIFNVNNGENKTKYPNLNPPKNARTTGHTYFKLNPEAWFAELLIVKVENVPLIEDTTCSLDQFLKLRLWGPD